MEISLKNHGVKFNSRPLADKIFSSIGGNMDLVINFSGVEEATPSFCHEMFTVLLSKKIRMSIVNANDSIKLQLNKALSSIH